MRKKGNFIGDRICKIPLKEKNKILKIVKNKRNKKILKEVVDIQKCFM